MRTLPVALFLSLVAACGGTSERGLAPGERLVTGRISVTADDLPPGQRLAAQVLAVHAAAECPAGSLRVGSADPAGATSACAWLGEPFDPGLQGGGVGPAPFELVVPCDLTVNLLVGTLGSSGGATPGQPLALLVYPDGLGATTSLLAREPGCRDTELLATNILDLGELLVPATPAPLDPPSVEVGGASGGENPLATIDTDQDLAPNVGDPDDDEDGIEDSADPDADGDGAADQAQLFVPAWLTGWQD